MEGRGEDTTSVEVAEGPSRMMRLWSSKGEWIGGRMTMGCGLSCCCCCLVADSERIQLGNALKPDLSMSQCEDLTVFYQTS